MTQPIEKILIANRGEIACRLIKTCRRLGIQTVALASTADRSLPYIRMADEVALLNGNTPKETYLNIKEVVDLACYHQVDAVHPGYGFLSENPDFAEALLGKGIRFIGPSPYAIRVMGSKAQAKKIAEGEKIPLIQGYQGTRQDVDFLREEAEKIGFPLLIKAAYGGGGKGMRVVHKGVDFVKNLESCQREAESAFGNTTMILEKYIENPRHIEVQVFGDSHGNLVTLMDRDCSLQRRHQKVIEEAPALGISDPLRSHLHHCALAISRAVHYQGAGTVEFLVDSYDHFYFLEMNTRLQVEHPVTEEILGLDLVEWQIRVTEGKPLPLSQDQIIPSGHAIEARLYAEDPDHEFLPSTGQLKSFKMPAFCRMDAGYEEGNSISIYYDPLIAKVIAKGETRLSALHTLRKALMHTHIQGVKTNQKFLLQLLTHPTMVKGLPDTGFIDHFLKNEERIPPFQEEEMILAGIILFKESQKKGEEIQSPWALKDRWRQGREGGHFPFSFQINDQDVKGVCHSSPPYLRIKIENQWIEVDHLFFAPQELTALIGGKLVKASWVWREDHTMILQTPSGIHEIKKQNPTVYEDSPVLNKGSLNAPMPGRLLSLLVKEDQRVEKGDPLLILEAMKMEYTIYAPTCGVVRTLFFQQGDFVEEGADLVVLEKGGKE